jgi:hypothetical protein
MRGFILGIALLALNACGQTEQRSACARVATHDVTWSSTTSDTITTSSEGPTCAQAIVTFVIRNSAGDPLWTFSSTYYDLTAGGTPPENAPAVTPEAMDAFLAGWARVSEMRSSELPEWREGAATLTESASTFAYDTPFDRETYEMLRTRNLPLLCYAAAVEGSQCLLIDPLSHAPTMIVAYGP